MSWLSKFWPKKADTDTEARNSVAGPVSISDPGLPRFLFGDAWHSSAGVTITAESAATFGAVYTCVNVIAQTIGALPLQVFRRAGEAKILAQDVAAYSLLHDRPNEWMSSIVWRQIVLAHVLLWGNHYSFIERNGRGEVIALYPLMPWLVSPRRLDSRAIIYEVSTNSGVERLASSQILHIQGIGWDGLKGLSPIAQQRNAIGAGMAADSFAGGFFKNDARPAIIVETPASTGTKAGAEMKAELEAKSKGEGKKWQVLVLGPGIKIHTLTMPNDDAMFVATRKYQRTEIYGMYRVPPHLAGDLEKATFSNIEQQDIGFAKHCILPWCRSIESEISYKLFGRGADLFAEFNLDGLMRGDFKTRMEGYGAAIAGGFMSREKAASLENLPAPPALKKFVIQGAMAIVNDDGSLTLASKPAERTP